MALPRPQEVGLKDERRGGTQAGEGEAGRGSMTQPEPLQRGQEWGARLRARQEALTEGWGRGTGRPPSPWQSPSPGELRLCRLCARPSGGSTWSPASRSAVGLQPMQLRPAHPSLSFQSNLFFKSYSATLRSLAGPLNASSVSKCSRQRLRLPTSRPRQAPGRPKQHRVRTAGPVPPVGRFLHQHLTLNYSGWH